MKSVRSGWNDLRSGSANGGRPFSPRRRIGLNLGAGRCDGEANGASRNPYGGGTPQTLHNSLTPCVRSAGRTPGKCSRVDPWLTAFFLNDRKPGKSLSRRLRRFSQRKTEKCLPHRPQVVGVDFGAISAGSTSIRIRIQPRRSQRTRRQRGFIRRRDRRAAGEFPPSTPTGVALDSPGSRGRGGDRAHPGIAPGAMADPESGRTASCNPTFLSAIPISGMTSSWFPYGVDDLDNPSPYPYR